MNKHEKSLLTELYWIIEKNKNDHHILYYSKDILGSILRGKYGISEKLIQRKTIDILGKTEDDGVTCPRCGEPAYDKGYCMEHAIQMEELNSLHPMKNEVEEK